MAIYSDHSLSAASPEALELASAVLAIQAAYLAKVTGELTRSEISFSQFLLLTHLDGIPALTMTSISRMMHHTTAASTGLVDRLRLIGYVQREHDKKDRRKVLISITPKGTRFIKKVKADIAATFAPALEALTATESKAALQIFQKVSSYCAGSKCGGV